ncbi:MAG: N-acetyltransferase [Candidatus Omnitrophica bacterium]|nr:N-acetyltransferase [Candidatus Omnitrophota bacterium]
MPILIREEQPSDIDIIREVTELAFRDCPYSCKREHLVIDLLRKADALALSLVAISNSEIVGHIALSPVSVSEAKGRWYGLGPISVLPRVQRMGIGSALMNAALSWMQQQNAVGCVLVGDPKYYIRFGFTNDPSLTVEGVPPAVTLSKRLYPNEDKGVVRFHGAFTE